MKNVAFIMERRSRRRREELKIERQVGGRLLEIKRMIHPKTEDLKETSKQIDEVTK